MADYLLTPQAQEQLEDIWLHTYDKWGAKQANEYLQELLHTCLELAVKRNFAKRHDDIHSGLRSWRCKHHYIFFLDSGELIVLAVLHERMDILTRLEEFL